MAVDVEIPREVVAMFDVAAALFPQASAPSSLAVRTLWGRSLWPRFSVDDVCFALERLAKYIGGDRDRRRTQRREIFPDLSEIITAAEEEQSRRAHPAQPLLEPPQAATTVQRRLDEFDNAGGDYRRTAHAELEDHVRSSARLGFQMPTAEHRADIRARLDTDGPFTQMARRLTERGEDPGRAAVAMVRAFCDSLSRPRPRQSTEVDAA